MLFRSKFTREMIGEEKLKMLEAIKAKLVLGKIHVPVNADQFQAFVSAQKGA